MALATLQNVRDLGNLPDSTKLDDSILQPHLNSAARRLEKWIGTYSSATGTKKERCIEAECCLTLAYATPVLNTFFTQGVTTLQKEMGDMEYLFHSPEDLEGIVTMWEDRARDAIAEYMHKGERPAVGWYAI